MPQIRRGQSLATTLACRKPVSFGCGNPQRMPEHETCRVSRDAGKPHVARRLTPGSTYPGSMRVEENLENGWLAYPSDSPPLLDPFPHEGRAKSTTIPRTERSSVAGATRTSDDSTRPDRVRWPSPEPDHIDGRREPTRGVFVAHRPDLFERVHETPRDRMVPEMNSS